MPLILRCGEHSETKKRLQFQGKERRLQKLEDTGWGRRSDIDSEGEMGRKEGTDR